MGSNFRQAFGFGGWTGSGGNVFEVSGRLGRGGLVRRFCGDATLIGLGAFWDGFPR